MTGADILSRCSLSSSPFNFSPQDEEARREAFIHANADAARIAQIKREEELAHQAEMAPRLKEQAIEEARAMAAAAAQEAEARMQEALERMDKSAQARAGGGSSWGDP